MKQTSLLDEEQPPDKSLNQAIQSISPHEFVEISPFLSSKIKTKIYLNPFPELTIQVVTQLEECQSLWRKYIAPQSLFDTWEFRYAFYLGFRHEPYFLLLKDQQDQVVAMLPLWYESDTKHYAWFGSWWQEDNKIFVTKREYLPFLLEAAPSPLILNAIEAAWLEETLPNWQNFNFQLDFPKFILDLSLHHSAEEFLSCLKKKKRYNLKRDRERILAQNPQFYFDRDSDLEMLIKLSTQRFEQKGEEASWVDPRSSESFRQVVKLGREKKSYQVRLISVEIAGQIAAVDLVTLFNGTYSPIKCGYDVENFPGIGNFLNLFEIDDACSLNMKKIDFLEMSYGWKEKWFQGVQLYKYQK